MPENWKSYKLSDLTSKIGSGSTPRGGKEAYKENGVSLIRSQNVLDFRFSTDGLAFIDDTQAKALSNVALKPKDVLINITGDSVARVCQVPENLLPARVNQHVAIIRANKEVLNPGFLLYSLLAKKSKDLLLTLASAGATRNALTKVMLEDFEILVPPIKEQNAIASILSALDDKIELNLQMNKTLEEMAMALYKHWFVDFGPFQNGKFVESELRLIPEGWEVVSIYKLIDVIYGAPFKSKLFNEDKEGYPLIRIRDLKSGKPQYFTEENHVNKTIIKKGDILAGMDALFAPYSWSGEEGVMNQRVVYFKPRIESVKRRYIYEAVKPWLRFYEGAKVGTTVIHLSKSDIDNFKLVYPKNHDTIKEVNDEIDALHELIISNDTEIATLTTLRDTLLPKLISGEIRVKDAEQRIAASL